MRAMRPSCWLALLWALSCAPAPAATPCRLPGVAQAAQCGTVQRPLDPARPQGPQIEVHYAVLPALARNKRPDPLLLFAGGPGQSAIGLAGAASGWLTRVLNRRDVVLIDQRGSGRSAPLHCEPDDPWAPLAQAFDQPRMQARLAACRERLQTLPHGDLRFYTTAIAVGDVDAVRARLGAERVNLVGASYGTRAALEYQRQFPQRVRRAVLDGMAPPDMGLPQTAGADNQAALDAVFAACAADAGCAQRHPQLSLRWRRFVATLPREMDALHPWTGRAERVRVTAPALAQLLRAPLYAPALAAALPAAMDAAIDGRVEPLVGLASALGGGARRPEQAMSQGLHFSVVCAEDAPRLGAPAADAATPADFGTSFGELYREACAGWPRGEVPPAFYTLTRAATPTLVFSGGLDPVTPPRHGERVVLALGANARHVVVPYAGHGVLAIGCVRDVLFRFIDAAEDGDALKVDADCVRAIPRPPLFEPPGVLR